MQLLKSIVIGLGVLIFLGLGLLGYGFIQKANDPGWRLFSSSPAPDDAPAPSPAKAFGSLEHIGCTRSSSHTIPLVLRSASVSSLSPSSSPNTSTLCSPRVGPGQRIPPGVAESFGTTFCIFSVG